MAINIKRTASKKTSTGKTATTCNQYIFILVVLGAFASLLFDTKRLGGIAQNSRTDIDWKEVNNEVPSSLVAYASDGTHFLSYELHYNESFEGIYSLDYHCPEIDGSLATRAPLSPKLVETFHFKTTISTNLKILTLGDSVGLQFHETLEEAANVHNYTERKVLRFAWGKFSGTSISTPIRGNGVLGSLRTTGWYLKGGEGKRIARYPSGCVHVDS